jgi:hypothetical protein
MKQFFNDFYYSECLVDTIFNLLKTTFLLLIIFTLVVMSIYIISDINVLNNASFGSF